MLRLAIACCALTFSAAAAAEPTWKDVEATRDWKRISVRNHEDAGPITVYTADVAGTPCFRALADTPAPADVLLEVAADIVGSLDWSSAGLSRSEVLAADGNSIDYLQYLDLPGWTLSRDRFWILRGTVSREGRTRRFTWQRLGEEGGPHRLHFLALQEETKAIEPPVNLGGWEFVRSEGKTRVRYTICTDSGGALPRSFQNLATRTTLPDTVGDLVREGLRRSP